MTKHNEVSKKRRRGAFDVHLFFLRSWTSIFRISPESTLRNRLHVYFKQKITLERINDDSTYYYLRTNEEQYFVKVFCSKRNSVAALQKIMNVLEIPTRYLHIRAFCYCAIEPFYAGHTAEERPEVLSDPTFARSIAHALRKLHALPVDKHMRTVNYKAYVWRIVRLFKLYQIDEIAQLLAFLQKTVAHIDDARCTLHADMQPKNVLLTENGACIIDYENALVGHPYQEFSYFMLMPDCHDLTRTLINDYFEGNIPFDFWQKNAFFVVLRFLETCRAHRDEPSTLIAVNAQFVYREFVALCDRPPTWW